MHPSAHTSVRRSTDLPRACSGSVVAGVPKTTPVAVARGAHLVFAVESTETFGVAGERFGKRLDGRGSAEADSSCAIDLAHAAAAERLDDLIVSQSRSGGQWHEPRTIARPFANAE